MRRRPALARLAVGVLAATAVLGLGGSFAGAASATPGGTPAVPAGQGCQTVHAGPELAGDDHQSYFHVTVAAGEVFHETVLVANPEPYPCSVTIEAASGQTAVNSGDTYPVQAGACVETGCWLGGLPAVVDVPARGRIDAKFRVSVPHDAAAGEYLAGVVVRPTDAPAAAGSTDGKQVAIAVTARVAIGVAVTVPGPMHPLISIPDVTLDVHAATPTLNIHVRNLGNTWEHPIGGATIRVGNVVRRFGVRASTVLAGDEAVLPLAAAGIAKGAWPTEVVLDFGGHQHAIWRGHLGYPTPPTPVAAAGRTSGQAAPAARAVPTWVAAAMGSLGLLVVLLIGILLFVLLRRRRENRDDDSDYRGRHSPAPTGT